MSYRSFSGSDTSLFVFFFAIFCHSFRALFISLFLGLPQVLFLSPSSPGPGPLEWFSVWLFGWFRSCGSAFRMVVVGSTVVCGLFCFFIGFLFMFGCGHSFGAPLVLSSLVFRSNGSRKTPYGFSNFFFRSSSRVEASRQNRLTRSPPHFRLTRSFRFLLNLYKFGVWLAARSGPSRSLLNAFFVGFPFSSVPSARRPQPVFLFLVFSKLFST